MKAEAATAAPQQLKLKWYTAQPFLEFRDKLLKDKQNRMRTGDFLLSIELCINRWYFDRF